MTEYCRVILIDGPEHPPLQKAADTLRRFPGIFQVTHTTNNEEAELAIGAHWHIGVVNMNADLRARHNRLLQRQPDRTPTHYAEELNQIGARVIQCEPPGTYFPVNRYVEVAVVVPYIFHMMRHVRASIPRHPPFEWLEPAKPREPFTPPERFCDPAIVAAEMSRRTRDQFESFLAGREAAHGR